MPERVIEMCEIHADALVEALGMSHGDLANLLRMALKAEQPNQTDYVWVKDIYDDAVIYEQTPKDDVSPTALIMRSYSILDGKVTFGDPVKVVAVTDYIAVDESADLDESVAGIAAWVRKHGGAHPHTACVAKFGNAAMCAKAVDLAKGTTKWRGGKKESADPDAPIFEGTFNERSFTQEQRDAMVKSGAAMSDGGFPIATKGDLKNAVLSYGRAVNKPAVKKHIIKRAKALGAVDVLPEDWNVTEAGEVELVTSDLVPLVEKSVNKDGEISLRIIAPGQGSSGYYSAEMLKRDGPKVFTTGLHMYADHPSATEDKDRPERSIKDLVGQLTSNAVWQDEGAAGPGLYATAKVRSDVAPLIEELAPSIGVSIRALGKASAGEVDGKKVRNVDSLEVAKSVDFVTVPGAGGKVLDLLESARERHTATEVDDMGAAEELAEAQKKIADLESWKADQEARAAEAILLAEARAIVGDTLSAIQLPELTRARLTKTLVGNPPIVDGKLDREAFVGLIKEAAKAETEYLAQIAGPSRVTGMGDAAPEAPTTETVTKSLSESFARLTGSDKLAEIAAAGR